MTEEYIRYGIHTEFCPNFQGHPDRFQVRVNRFGLAKLLLQEMVHQRGDLEVVTSRPCMYGVFSGPIGGFAPRPQYCVGCLRCTVEYPEMVEVSPNPERIKLGDSYVDPDQVDTILYEASTGHVPVRGAGYRGKLGGHGWDEMWTDMSEIVRPTRDGIHGREYISTSVDIGEKLTVLEFSQDGSMRSKLPKIVSIPIPFIIDRMPASVETSHLYKTILVAAERIQTLAIIPIQFLEEGDLSKNAVPLVRPVDVQLLNGRESTFEIIELDGWDGEAYDKLHSQHPDSIIIVREEFKTDLNPVLQSGVKVLHLTANYHGNTGSGFIQESVQNIHLRMVEDGTREAITVIGSGGIAQAEHVPKSIISGFDLVALDTPIILALQGQFIGEVENIDECRIELSVFETQWGAQRIQNLIGSWRDQLLEILGAMGLREVRRLRGELGRAMFNRELERESFAGIEGFDVAEIWIGGDET